MMAQVIEPALSPGETCEEVWFAKADEGQGLEIPAQVGEDFAGTAAQGVAHEDSFFRRIEFLANLFEDSF